jgi:hypothetical protein
MTKRIPDSRLVNCGADIQAIGAQLTEIIGETTLTFPEASLQLTEVLRLLSDAHTVLNDVVDWPVPLTTKCGTYSSLGSRCVLDMNHPGPHKASHGFEWTDEQDAASALAIAKSMEGRRD